MSESVRMDGPDPEDIPYPVAEDEFRRLLRLQETGVATRLNDPALDALCAEACEHFSVSTAAVTVLDEDLQYLRAKAGIDAESTPRCIAFCNYTILERDVFVVSDARQSPLFRDNPLVTGAPFVRFYAGAALIYSTELTFGAFCLLDPEPREFTLGDRAELVDFADRGVALIHRWILAQR